VFYDGFARAGDGDVLNCVASSLEGGGFEFRGRASYAQREDCGLAGLHFGMQDLGEGLGGLMRVVWRPDQAEVGSWSG
jgi:hypothetical protein